MTKRELIAKCNQLVPKGKNFAPMLQDGIERDFYSHLRFRLTKCENLTIHQAVSQAEEGATFDCQAYLSDVVAELEEELK